MTVRLLFFAVLRDIASADEREIELDEGATPEDVWRSLREAYPRLNGFKQAPMAAINETYADASTLLRNGDVLAFIPPVAGG
jgi:molybdopterin converting factor subunit 1